MPRKVIDLSRTIYPGMPVYPGTPYPEITPIATLAEKGFRESRLYFSSHTGTHLDAPYHMLEDGATLDRFAAERFLGKGRVLDCSSCGPLISRSFLGKCLQEFFECEYLLFYTGWEDKWGKAAYYSRYPVLTPEAAGFLGDMGLKGIGVDAISVDSSDAQGYPIHQQLLRRNVLIVENLVHLPSLLNQDFLFACFPLPLKDGEASPVRAVGIVQCF